MLFIRHRKNTEHLLEKSQMEGRHFDFKKAGFGLDDVVNLRSRMTVQQRTQVDAFLLLLSFLVHSDNKAENQGLACLDKNPSRNGVCQNAVAFVDDLGNIFGRGWDGMNRNRLS